jgi:hypothetical protein
VSVISNERPPGRISGPCAISSPLNADQSFRRAALGRDAHDAARALTEDYAGVAPVDTERIEGGADCDGYSAVHRDFFSALSAPE